MMPERMATLSTTCTYNFKTFNNIDAFVTVFRFRLLFDAPMDKGFCERRRLIVVFRQRFKADSRFPLTTSYCEVVTASTGKSLYSDTPTLTSDDEALHVALAPLSWYWRGIYEQRAKNASPFDPSKGNPFMSSRLLDV